MGWGRGPDLFRHYTHGARSCAMFAGGPPPVPVGQPDHPTSQHLGASHAPAGRPRPCPVPLKRRGRVKRRHAPGAVVMFTSVREPRDAQLGRHTVLSSRGRLRRLLADAGDVPRVADVPALGRLERLKVIEVVAAFGREDVVRSVHVERSKCWRGCLSQAGGEAAVGEVACRGWLRAGRPAPLAPWHSERGEPAASPRR